MPYRLLLLLAGLACMSAAIAAERGRVTATLEQPTLAAEAIDGVLRNVNAFRHAQGRGSVTPEARLTEAAQVFAQVMARTDRFSHEADGKEPTDRAVKHGYAYCTLSENIGFEQRRSGFSSDELARRLVEGWKNSPPHRHNMLDPDVTDTGVGLAQSARSGRWYAVQMFGTPESARSHFEISNEAGATVHYRLGERRFELGPRVTRTHEECRSLPLTLEGSAAATGGALHPHVGEHYSVVRNGAGALTLTTR